MYLLYSHLHTKPAITPEATDYYTLLDIFSIAENLYGPAAAHKLVTNHNYIEFLFQYVHVFLYFSRNCIFIYS